MRALVVGGLFLAGLLLVSAANGQIAFEKSELDLAHAGGFLTADLNRDGVPDLVAGTNVLLGNGDGTFRRAPDLAAPGASVSADFNGDGIVDLAGFDRSGHRVLVWLGNGDGTFRDPVATVVANDANSLAAADFNGDGKSDLALANTSGTVTILFGQGDGTFTARNFPAGTEPFSVVTGDFNGDGIPDVAVAYCCSGMFGTGAEIRILLNNGDGSLGAPSVISAFGITALYAADLNNDGFSDLLVPFRGCHTPCSGVTVLINNHDGTFRQSALPVDSSQAVSVGDFNDDGIPDVAVVYTDYDGSGDKLAITLGRGDGTFDRGPLYMPGAAPISVVSADFNQDGNIDIAVENDGSVNLFTGQGDGTFRLPLRNLITVYGYDIALGQLRAGSFPDAVVAGSAERMVNTYQGNGDGTFQLFSSSPGSGNAWALILADVNHDGILDAVSTESDYPNAFVSVRLGNGDGTFGEPRRFPTNGLGFQVGVADFDGDGNSDLLVLGADTLRVYFGDGTGNFGGPVDTSFRGRRFAIGDFNGDGIPDVAVLAASTSAIDVFIGRGDGTFNAPTVYPGQRNPNGLFTADLTGSGTLDLVYSDVNISYQSFINILRGNGDGTFRQGAQLPVPQPSFPYLLSSADFDGDGRLDIVGAGSYHGTVLIWRGHGDGTFDPALSFASASSMWAFSVADVNGDGKPDIVILNIAGNVNAISVLLNRTP